MASQSQGIQQLLQAEKRAAEKVADARKRKARRLKQAKEEAQMEVEQYRREREQEFQSKQQALFCQKLVFLFLSCSSSLHSPLSYSV